MLATLVAAQSIESPQPEVLGAYTNAQAQIALMLSNVAYCGKDAYMSHTYSGVLSGFKPTYVIYSGIVDDTEGLVGILPSDASIYISFRGSSNIQNWITNLSTSKTAYTTFPDCNCQVH
jgi:hypothetical protein